jgi:hypothetical protein
MAPPQERPASRSADDGVQEAAPADDDIYYGHHEHHDHHDHHHDHHGLTGPF